MAFCSRCKGATHESLSCLISLHTHARPTGVFLVLAGRPACFEAKQPNSPACMRVLHDTCQHHLRKTCVGVALVCIAQLRLRLRCVCSCMHAHGCVCSGTVTVTVCPRKSSCSKSSAAQYREVSTHHHTGCHCKLPAPCSGYACAQRNAKCGPPTGCNQYCHLACCAWKAWTSGTKHHFIAHSTLLQTKPPRCHTLSYFYENSSAVPTNPAPGAAIILVAFARMICSSRSTRQLHRQAVCSRRGQHV